LQPGQLPAPDVTVGIAQLRPCDSSPDATLRFNSRRPVAVLVHGCRGSAGHFRSLAQLYAFHGQQAICFSYDAGDSLVRSASQLQAALRLLAGHLQGADIRVIGHSMGGLVARKAMEGAGGPREPNIDLVTISAPFAGIAVASPCGNKALQWLSLGLVPGICWAITGDNWHEITAASSFIRNPGELPPSIRRHLKIVTDERNSCRRAGRDGACLESDEIFSVAEQYHPLVESFPRLTNVEVRAGHVEIVGSTNVVPRKLLAILQEQGVLASTPQDRQAALEQLLARLY
jgi:dienelactone hydrolase